MAGTKPPGRDPPSKKEPSERWLGDGSIVPSEVQAFGEALKNPQSTLWDATPARQCRSDGFTQREVNLELAKQFGEVVASKGYLKALPDRDKVFENPWSFAMHLNLRDAPRPYYIKWVLNFFNETTVLQIVSFHLDRQ